MYVPVLVAIAAAILGGALAGPGGFFYAALAGFLVTLVLQQRRTLERLALRVETLDLRVGAAAPPATAPPAGDSTAVVQAEEPWGPPGTAEPQVSDVETVAPHTALPATPPAESVRPAAGWDGPRPPSAAGLLVARAWDAVRRFFTTGNLVVRVGVVVLFFGVAFLLRYAYEHALLPIELRLAGTTIGGIALTVAGWRWRARTDSYGVVLQGAGVGVLYLTIFAAARLYDLMPLPAAFLLITLLVAASCVLAVLQNAQALALFAMSGGFLAPVLVSTGEGSHVALFSYYAVLNAGILGMAWFRSWRWLNWLGFMFTFVIGASWGYQYYRPELFASTEPFLVLFFLYYLGVSVLFARRQGANLRGLVDGTLVFGVPLAASALQWGLVRDLPFGMAYSALGASIIYVSLAWWLKRRGAMTNLLGQSFLALAIVFATLAIPFALDNQRLTGAAWALEGAGLLWVGIRQRQVLARLFGIALQFAAAAAFVIEWPFGMPDTLVLNSDLLSGALIGIAGLVSAWLLSAPEAPLHRLERPLRWLLLGWGTLWWAGAGLREIGRYRSDAHLPFEPHNTNEHLALLFLAASTAILTLLGRRLRWREALLPGYLLLPAAVYMVVTLYAGWRSVSALADLGWLAWPATFAALYLHLAAADDEAATPFWHAATWWFAAFMGAWTAAAALYPILPDSAWVQALWGAVPLLAILALAPLCAAGRWPFPSHRASYTGWGLAVMLGALVVWLLVSAFSPGNPAPLPYLVVVNPLELTQLAILLVAWQRLSGGTTPLATLARLAVGASAFVWLNLTAARAVHYYAGVSYPVFTIIDSDAFQTTISILWTTLALALMGMGTARTRRSVWIIGAVLLALVIFKLFTVDISRLELLARIVSFIAVGALMLVIGWFAPLPPARRAPDGEPPEPAPPDPAAAASPGRREAVA